MHAGRVAARKVSAGRELRERAAALDAVEQGRSLKKPQIRFLGGVGERGDGESGRFSPDRRIEIGESDSDAVHPFVGPGKSDAEAIDGGFVAGDLHVRDAAIPLVDVKRKGKGTPRGGGCREENGGRSQRNRDRSTVKTDHFAFRFLLL